MLRNQIESWVNAKIFNGFQIRRIFILPCSLIDSFLKIFYHTIFCILIYSIVFFDEENEKIMNFTLAKRIWNPLPENRRGLPYWVDRLYVRREALNWGVFKKSSWWGFGLFFQFVRELVACLVEQFGLAFQFHRSGRHPERSSGLAGSRYNAEQEAKVQK